MNEIPDFNKIITEISLPGKHFDPNNKLTQDGTTYIMNRHVELETGNNYSAGCFDHYHFVGKKGTSKKTLTTVVFWSRST